MAFQLPKAHRDHTANEYSEDFIQINRMKTSAFYGDGMFPLYEAELRSIVIGYGRTPPRGMAPRSRKWPARTRAATRTVNFISLDRLCFLFDMTQRRGPYGD